MKKKLNLILCASGHLPSGSCDADFESLYINEIKPLVSALNKFPKINFTFHYSGVILYWIERRHPELLMLLEDLLSRKQAEFLGGGFYNPMLPLLPAADKIGQIEMLITYLRKHFGRRPQGCWLPPMSWEQSLIRPLSSCGMNYVFLEDSMFSGAGLSPGPGGIFYPCITEDQGKLITVFPVAKAIGRELLKGMPEKTLAEIFEKHSLEINSPIIVLPVGGEIFSAAGENHNPESFYKNLFEELSALDSLVEFSYPAEIYKNLRALKKIYFPSPQAGENGDEYRTSPRQFIADHPEAGGIYAKTLYVHTLINTLLRGDKVRKRTAFEELWKAQDSGLFRLGSAAVPGLLHSPVRKAAYRSLLESEKITREKKKFVPSLSVFDYDLDGEGEYIFNDDKVNCCIKPRGAGILELDYLPGAWNYLDTMATERGDGRRCAFVDWIAPAGTLPGHTDQGGGRNGGRYGFKGGRFCGCEEYEALEVDRVRRRVKFRLPPKEGFPWGELEMEKTWQLKKNSLALDYMLKNTGTDGMNFVFCPQADLSFPWEGENFLRIFSVREEEKENIIFDDAGVVKDTKIIEFQDIKNEAVISLEASRSFDGHIFHIHTEPGGYQSTCLMFLLPVSLEGGKTWKLSFSLKIIS